MASRSACSGDMYRAGHEGEHEAVPRRWYASDVIPSAMANADPAPFDPILAAIDAAPTGEPLTPEQRAELDQAVADIDAGRTRPVPHEEVPAWLEEMANCERDG